MHQFGLSTKIALFCVFSVFCVYLVESLIIDSVLAVYDNKGNLIAEVGMTRNEIISNIGKHYVKDELWNSDRCLCYPVSFQDKIKTSYWRRELPGNYLKIMFNGERVEELYFWGHFRGATCAPHPPLAIKIQKSPYR